jgi:hypothetical protein
MFLDDVMNKFIIVRQVAAIAKCGSQRSFLVTIARNQVKRRVKWCKKLTQQCILLRLAMLHRITGKDHSVRLLLVDIRDAAPQAVSPQFRSGMIRFRRQDVRIANLGDKQ